jgi:excisionase family DNA binding protein
MKASRIQQEGSMGRNRPRNFDRRLAFGPNELPDLLGISAAAVDKHIRSGAIPSVLLGRRRLVSRSTLERLLAGELPAGPREVVAR